MTPRESKLFWDIISCPRTRSSSNNPCHRIIAIQNGNDCWQVPEPWNGSLSEEFLIIGGNPAIDLKELYPATIDVNNPSWCAMGNSGIKWSNSSVETFFEKRFGFPSCHAFGSPRPYVDTTNSSILQTDGTYKCPKNEYWSIYNKICKAIDSTFEPWRFAITDIVHCKSSSSQGLTSATYKICVNHTKEIVDLFTKQSQSSCPVIVLIGSSANSYVDMLLDGKCISNTVIGSYDYTRGGFVQTKDIILRKYSYMDKTINIVCGIPAPSRANGQMSNIVINGHKIW